MARQCEIRVTNNVDFQDWADALVSCSCDRMAGLFWEDAVFLPTFSDLLVTTLEGVIDYFWRFFKKQPVCILLEEETRVLGERSYFHTGLYRFILSDGSVANARFTFIWLRRKGEWKIIHFHSSELPKV